MQISRRGFGALLAPLLVVTTSVAVVLDPAVDQSVAAASTSIVTGAHDDLRTGWYPDQPGLGPDDVASAQFGPLFDQGQIDGQVYAQPLVADGRVLIATETNFVYSLDPTTGAINWSRQLRAPYAIAADTAAPNNMDDCGDLTPNIGITGTPVVVDDTMYLYSKGYVSGPTVSDTNVGYWLHAIDITTGEERPSFPVQIPPGRTADNDPGTHPRFIARYELQRPALLYQDGVVYAGFGGHCDKGPFRGWVIGVTTADNPNGGGIVSTMWTSAASAFSGGGIWQSGSGIMSDGPGRLFVSTGNGVSLDSTPVAAADAPDNCSECVLRLDAVNGTLQSHTFFQPYDAPHLDTIDADFASGGPVALPGNFGTTGANATPAFAGSTIVAVGKEGYVYLLDADHLGGYRAGSGGGDDVLSRVGPDGGVWSKPTVWPGDGGWVYVPTAAGNLATSGSAGFLNAYQKAGTADQPSLALRTDQSNADAFGFGSSAPVVTSNGTTDGSGVVWIVWMGAGSGGANAQLRAYQTTPDENGQMRLLRSFPIGKGTKFNPPGVGNNRIYVATQDGHVRGFGTPTTAPLAGSSLSFGQVVVGSSVDQDASLTVNAPAATVTDVQLSGAAFSLGTVAPAPGQQMAQGDQLTVPVTFHPTVPGTATGELRVTTDSGDVVLIGLNGVGEPATAVLRANPTAISFGGVELGGSRSSVVTLTNTGATPLTFDGAVAPSGAFAVTGLPGSAGQPTSLAPLASTSIVVAYAPKALGVATGALTVKSSGGDVTVQLSGSSSTPAKLAVSAKTVDLGDAVVGKSSTRVLQVSNVGGLPLTITKSKAPTSGAFRVSNPIPEGTTVPVGQTISVVVTFTPTAAGAQSASWALNGSGSSQVTTVTMRGTGVAAAPAGGMSFTQPAQTPARLYDTRTIKSPLAAGATRTIPVLGRAGVPASGVAGVSVTASAVNPRGTGSLSIFPCGTSPTATSTANFSTGHGVSNLALVPVGGGGAICARASVATDLVIDVDGSTSPDAGSLSTAVAPVRLFDTRQTGGSFKAGETRIYQVVGRAGVPVDATGVLANITSVGSTATGSLVVYPCGLPRPAAVNMTYIAHTTIATLTDAALGDGAVCVFATAPTHVLFDIIGYVRTNGGSLTRSINPWRALDTSAPSPGQRLPAKTSKAVTVVNPARGVPKGVTSVLLNVTAVSPLAAGSLVVYPCGSAVPAIANLAYTAGARVNNMVRVRVPASGQVCVSTQASSHVVVDVLGYTK